jgi:hypothetical protein
MFPSQQANQLKICQIEQSEDMLSRIIIFIKKEWHIAASAQQGDRENQTTKS